MKQSFVFLSILLSSLFISCATKVRYEVVRPAELNLNGAKTISVLPIKPYSSLRIKSNTTVAEIIIGSYFGFYDSVSRDEKKAIEYLQTSIENGLMSSPYIDLISSDAVKTAIDKGYLNPADVYFTGEVTYYNVNDRIKTERVSVESKYTDSNGKKKKSYVYVDYYYRDVSFDFKYQIVDSSNNKIIAYEKISIDNSSGRYKSIRDLPSPYSLIENKLKSTASKILKELQPYVVVKSLSLLEDKNKNPDMKNANELAKEYNINDSYRLYRKLYDENGIFEAGYNAALLKQAMGELSDAEDLMSQLYEKTLDSRAYKALSDIRYEIDQANKLFSQTREESDYLE